MHPICQEKVLVCLRRDDPLAQGETIPQNVIAGRLCILFGRIHQPLYYDALIRKFTKFHIDLHPSDFVSAPAELKYLVKLGKGFGLVQESTQLDPELTMMSIAGINLTVTTAFICHPAQIRPCSRCSLTASKSSARLSRNSTGESVPSVASRWTTCRISRRPAKRNCRRD